MEDGFEKLTAGDKTCETCRPDGLKVSNVNGIRRIEVPETFGRTPGATLETEIAEAMSIAANFGGSSFIEVSGRRIDSGLLSEPRVRASGLLVHGPAGTQDRQIEVTGPIRNFTLAETDAVDVLGLMFTEEKKEDDDSPTGDFDPEGKQEKDAQENHPEAGLSGLKASGVKLPGGKAINDPRLLANCDDVMIKHRTKKYKTIYTWKYELPGKYADESEAQGGAIDNIDDIAEAVNGTEKKDWTVDESKSSSMPELNEDFFKNQAAKIESEDLRCKKRCPKMHFDLVAYDVETETAEWPVDLPKEKLPADIYAKGSYFSKIQFKKDDATGKWYIKLSREDVTTVKMVFKVECRAS